MNIAAGAFGNGFEARQGRAIMLACGNPAMAVLAEHGSPPVPGASAR